MAGMCSSELRRPGLKFDIHELPVCSNGMGVSIAVESVPRGHGPLASAPQSARRRLVFILLPS